MEINQDTDYQEGTVLLFDKPLYWTSFDLVKKVKNIILNSQVYKKLKVGHAGTLDPLASGLLIICTGRFTKRISSIQEGDKEYIARIHLGATTPSYDLETEIDKRHPVDHITSDLVVKALRSFEGEIDQVPPVYSAKHIKGKRAYDYARKGIDVKMQARRVTFHQLELIDFSMPCIDVRIVCSKGTYVRSFARDLGLSLNSGAYLAGLKRTAIGEYRLEDALQIDDFESLVRGSKHQK